MKRTKKGKNGKTFYIKGSFLILNIKFLTLGKEMTVLELLELQARARAIRSQLALEPITKIELDSDEDSENEATPETSKKSTDKPKVVEKPKIPEKAKKTNLSVASTSKADKTPAQEAAPPTRVRLKRNFRKRPSVESEPAPKQKITEVVIEKAKSPVSKPESDNDSRSSSPDVIAMHASPETLCISSDDDSVENKKVDLSADKKFVESILAASVDKVVQKIVEPPKVVQKEPSVEKSVEPEIIREPSPVKEKVYEEPEEGEYSEESEPEQQTVEQDSGENADDVVELAVSKEVSSESESDPEPQTEEIPSERKSRTTSKSNESDSGDEQKDENDQAAEETPQVEECFEDVEKIKRATQEISTHDPDDEDIVEILNSSDEDMLGESDEKATPVETPQSWESRWLDSNNVKKILATSKLQNKVRAKRTKKNSKSEASSSDAKTPDLEPEQVPENFEEGSVQQFEVLKETSNSGM